MTKLMQLAETGYKNDLFALVSDPSLVGDQRRSKRINLNNLPSKGRVWDITPTTSPLQTPDLQFDDLFQMNFNAGQLGIDQSSPLINISGNPIYKHGCAKSNINLAMLNDGDSWHVGFRVVTNNTGFCLDNLMFYDKNASASALAAMYLNVLVSGSQFVAPMLLVSASRSNAQLELYAVYYDPVADDYVTSPSPFPTNYSIGTQGANNNTAVLLLSRNGNTLNAAIASVDTASNYDIHVIRHLGNDENPFPFDDLSLFIYAGTLASPQPEYQIISPTLTVGLPSYDVLNTTYNLNYSGTQQLFNEAFQVEPHRPSGVTVTQSEFPEGVMVGEYLNTYLDPNYSGVAPKPYGVLVSGDKTVVVTSITLGNEEFELLIRGAEFAQLASTVANISNNSMQGLFYGEIVVYVNNELDNVDLFTGDRSFNTFDAAYEYLILLPAYIPKRIVLDDRPIANTGPNYFVGVIGKLYMFGMNNIKLSTYCAFSGEPYPKIYNANNEHRPNPDINPWLYLRDMSFDSLHLVDFWGTFIQNQNADAHVWLGGANQTQTSPSSMLAGNLRLGKNTAVYATKGTIDYYDGGDILLEDGAFLKLYFQLYKGGGSETPLNTPFNIHKSAKARLHVTVYGANYLNHLPLTGQPYQMTVYQPEGSTGVEFPSNSGGYAAIVNIVNVNYSYDPVFTIDNVVMVRNLTDFKPDYDYSGVLVLPTTAKTFFIVGTVNLGPHVLYGGSGNAKHHFMGFPDSKLVADTYILTSNSINSSQSFKFSNLQLQTLSVAAEQTVITMESGGLDITDCIIDAPAGVWYIANAVPANAKVWPINVKSTEFKSDARTPGSIIRLNSHCNVAVRDVTYSGDVFPSQPVMDIRGLNVTAHVIVDGFTVVGNDESISSPLFIVDDLQRANGYISVKGVHVTHGNINAATPTVLGLFTKNYHRTNIGYYDAYNNVQDNRIVTDSTCGFVILKAPSIVAAVSNTSSDNVISLDETTIAQSYSKKYGFTNAISGMQNYTLNEHKLFEIRLKANVGAGANLTVRFKFKRIDKLTDVEHESDYVEVVLNGSGTGTVDATFYRELISGGMYALVVQNVSAPINVSITNVVFTIREF